MTSCSAIGPSAALHIADPKFRLVVIYATDGEAGKIAADSGVQREDLGTARRREAEDGWHAIGRLPDRTEWLGAPDGALVDHPFDDVVDRIAEVLAQERPGTTS